MNGAENILQNGNFQSAHHFEEHIVGSGRRKASENLPRQNLINTSPHLRQGELSRITVMMILDKKLENDGFDHYDSDPDDDPDPFLEYRPLQMSQDNDEVA